MNYSETKVWLWIKKFLFAFAGVLFMGFGIAFNSMAGFGNDPISVLYDGIKNFFHINLGIASMAANAILLIIIFFVDKKYINVGTLLYILALGAFIDLGIVLYKNCNLPETMFIKILSSCVGCLILFLGIAMYIFVNIGLDTWSGVTVLISEKLNISYKFVKISMDAICVLLGWILGGVVGIVTIIAAILGGPVIEKIKKSLDKTMLFSVKIK